MCTWAETEKLDGSGDVATTACELARSFGCQPSDLVSLSGRVLDEDDENYMPPEAAHALKNAAGKPPEKSADDATVREAGQDSVGAVSSGGRT